MKSVFDAMGGNYSDISDMTNDTELRELIKNAIKGSIDEANEYHQMESKIEKVDTKAHQVALNDVNSGGYVILGSANKPMNIKQSIKAESVVRTLHVANYISKQKEPIVQLVTCDLSGITQSDAAEKELPKWYDAKYVLEMLGYRVKDAEFDFENNRITYHLSVSDNDEEYIEQVRSAFENTQLQQRINHDWNENHAMMRAYYLSRQDELDALKARLEAIYKSDSATNLNTQLQEIYLKVLAAKANSSLYLNIYTTSPLFKSYEQAYINQQFSYTYIEDVNKNEVEKIIDNVSEFLGLNPKNTDESDESIFQRLGQSETDYDLRRSTHALQAYVDVRNHEIYKTMFATMADVIVEHVAIHKSPDPLTTSLTGLRNSSTVYGTFARKLLTGANEQLKSDTSDEYDEQGKKIEDPDAAKKHKEERYFANVVNTLRNITRLTWLNMFLSKEWTDECEIRYGTVFQDFRDLIATFQTKYSEYKHDQILYAMKDIDRFYNSGKGDPDSSSEAKKRKDYFYNYSGAGTFNNFKEAHQNYINYTAALNQQSAQMILYNDALNEWKKRNKDKLDEAEELEKRISSYESELESSEAQEAMKYFEYWDTDEINRQLVYRIQDDVDKQQALFDKMFDDEEEKALSREVFNWQSKVFQDQNDQQLWKSLIAGSVPYSDTASKLFKDIDINEIRGPPEIEQKLDIIKSNELYKTKYAEMIKDMEPSEIASLQPSQVIVNIDDDQIQHQFRIYFDELEAWKERYYGFESILSKAFNREKEFTDSHKADYENLIRNQASYYKARNEEPIHRAKYREKQKEYNDKYGESFEKLAKVQEVLMKYQSAYSTKKSIWENYDEVVNGTAYKWKTFDELYAILAAGYVQSINEKVSNFTTKSKNLIRNIEETSDLFAQNIVTIHGKFENAFNSEQSINVKQILENSVKIVDEQLKKDKAKNPSSAVTPAPIQSSPGTDSTINPLTEPSPASSDDSTNNTVMIIIIICIGLAILAVAIAAFIYLKRKPKSRHAYELIRQNQY